MHLDACLHLDDFRPDFQQLQADRFESRRGKGGAPEQVGLEGVDQDIGRRMQEDPELVGKKAMARGPVALHERFMRLDVEFIVATSAVNLLVQSLGLCLLYVGADEAHVQPLFGHLDLGDHSAAPIPAPCLILEGMVTAVSGSMLLDLLNNVLDGAEQHVITAEAGHAVAVPL